MTQDFVVALGQNALSTALLIAAPMLISGLIVGLAISVFQAVTQMQEMTLTFIPKIIVVLLVVFIFLPWMLNTLITFTMGVFNSIPSIAH